MITTRSEAEAFVIRCIEASGDDVANRDEYDIAAIAQDLHDVWGTWDIDYPSDDASLAEIDNFWETIAKHAY